MPPSHRGGEQPQKGNKEHEEKIVTIITAMVMIFASAVTVLQRIMPVMR